MELFNELDILMLMCQVVQSRICVLFGRGGESILILILFLVYFNEEAPLAVPKPLNRLLLW